ncbi:phospholipase B-like, partial [Haematococcus lacustris]
MLANNGSAWATLATMHNSGTYNCQYMVVDLKRFQPGEELQSGLLTIVETMPGGSAWADTTQELERGYWPSYNVPYFPEIYAGMGYPHVRAALRKRGQAFDSLVAGLSYQVCSRAKLLRRDAGNVTNYAMGLAMQAEAVNGPAWAADGNGQPPFSWSAWPHVAHRGMINTYRTAFEMQEP